jgi:hypothetical protein
VKITLQRIEAQSYNSSRSARHRPTAYRVLADGVEIGRVFSRSRESWRTLSSGVRYSFRGYSRTWHVEAVNGETTFAYQRQDAVAALVRIASASPPPPERESSA